MIDKTKVRSSWTSNYSDDNWIYVQSSTSDIHSHIVYLFTRQNRRVPWPSKVWEDVAT